MIATSIHGLATVLVTTGKSQKVIWSAVFSACLVFLFYSIGDSFMDFLKKEALVHRHIKDNPVPFPAVTFCNLNAYKRSAVGLIPELAALNIAYDELMLELGITQAVTTSEVDEKVNQKLNQYGLNQRRKRSVYCQPLDSDLFVGLPFTLFENPVNDSVDLHEVGSTSDAVCHNGYRQVGNGTFQCQPNATWLGEVPVCQDWVMEYVLAEENQDCDEACFFHRYDSFCNFKDAWSDEIPNQVLNVAKLLLKTIQIDTVVTSYVDQFIPPEIVINADKISATLFGWLNNFNETPSCSDLPAVQKGRRICQCQTTHWGDSPVDHSSAPSCPKIVIPKMMVHYWPTSNLVPGTIVDFTCFVDHKLVGYPMATCNGTGDWSRELPTCRRES